MIDFIKDFTNYFYTVDLVYVHDFIILSLSVFLFNVIVHVFLDFNFDELKYLAELMIFILLIVLYFIVRLYIY